VLARLDIRIPANGLIQIFENQLSPIKIHAKKFADINISNIKSNYDKRKRLNRNYGIFKE
jgi:hypothetical protein